MTVIALSFNDAVRGAVISAPLTIDFKCPILGQVLDHFKGLTADQAKSPGAIALCPKPLAGLAQVPLFQRARGRLPTIVVVDGGSAVRGELDLHELRNEVVRPRSAEFKGPDDDGSVCYVVNAGRFGLTPDQVEAIATRTGLRVEERHVPAHIADGEWGDIGSFCSRRMGELGALRLPSNAYGTGRVLYNLAGLGFLAVVDGCIIDGIGERFPGTVELVQAFDPAKKAQAEAEGRRYSPPFVVGNIHDLFGLRLQADEILVGWAREESAVAALEAARAKGDVVNGVPRSLLQWVANMATGCEREDRAEGRGVWPEDDLLRLEELRKLLG